jgi:valyl-tRNA synthetase
LATYPADVIRFWTASGSLGYDVAFSENQLKIGQKLVTKLWNAFWFVHTHITALDTHTKPAELGAVNEWILHKATDCFSQYQKALDMHEFSAALASIEQFFWHNFCDNYLELIKNQLFNPQEYAQSQVEATRWTLYQVGLRILQLYAPYLPYVTEAIYQELYQKKEQIPSLHQTKFAAVQHEYQYPDTAHLMQQIVTITANVRKLKTSKQLSLKTALAHLTITLDDETLVHAIKQHDQLIRGITQAENTSYSFSATGGSSIEEKDGAWHALTSNT